MDVSQIETIRLGTTVATNALLEKKGEKIAFLTTKGFKDYLHIGDQSRPDLFKLFVEKPGVLYEKVVEIDERVTLAAFSEDPEERDYRELLDGKNYVEGKTKDVIHILKPIDLDIVKEQFLAAGRTGRPPSFCTGGEGKRERNERTQLRLSRSGRVAGDRIGAAQRSAGPALGGRWPSRDLG